MIPSTRRTEAQGGLGYLLMALIALILIALVYWPVHRGEFVWDDMVNFHDNAWLRSGGDWRMLVLHGYPGWKSYFRPLGVALFVAEIGAFPIAPGPMHFVSLTLHLINTGLVGLLAWRLCPADAASTISKKLVCVAMLVYGLHPALIETVGWISSQFDLVATLFMLGGLLLNLQLRNRVMRGVCVGSCFFLAACAKESAVAFPVLLVLIDWIRPDDDSGSPQREAFLATVRRQWAVYVFVLAAGIGYLALRHWALAGFAEEAAYQPFLTWQRFQTVCFTYLVYWRTIIWPFVGLSPEHIVSAGRFSATNSISLAMDFFALLLAFSGLMLTCKRSRIGILVVGVTAALFPVLHVIPIAFDESLYHERYATPAIAFACALLPGICSIYAASIERMRAIRWSLVAMILLWLVLAAFNIRITLPLWSNNVSLWKWAVKANPDDPGVMDHLLAAYLDHHDWIHAGRVADSLMSTGKSCTSCMLNVAILALKQGDAKRAELALGRANEALSHIAPTQGLVIGYVLANAGLHELENDLAGAEAAYRAAISMDPKRSDAHMGLALLLASQGRSTEARAELDKALSLSAADDAASLRSMFNATLAKRVHSGSIH